MLFNETSMLLASQTMLCSSEDQDLISLWKQAHGLDSHCSSQKGLVQKFVLLELKAMTVSCCSLIADNAADYPFIYKRKMWGTEILKTGKHSCMFQKNFFFKYRNDTKCRRRKQAGERAIRTRDVIYSFDAGVCKPHAGNQYMFWKHIRQHQAKKLCFGENIGSLCFILMPLHSGALPHVTSSRRSAIGPTKLKKIVFLLFGHYTRFSTDFRLQRTNKATLSTFKISNDELDMTLNCDVPINIRKRFFS